MKWPGFELHENVTFGIFTLNLSLCNTRATSHRRLPWTSFPAELCSGSFICSHPRVQDWSIGWRTLKKKARALTDTLAAAGIRPVTYVSHPPMLIFRPCVRQADMWLNGQPVMDKQGHRGPGWLTKGHGGIMGRERRMLGKKRTER